MRRLLKHICGRSILSQYGNISWFPDTRYDMSLMEYQSYSTHQQHFVFALDAAFSVRLSESESDVLSFGQLR
jgi:hypothetical protein